MTSQLIDLVNTTNNIVYENLQKLNSKFKNLQKNQIVNEDEEYDSLNCKINIYFTTFIEQMKMKFILATQEYEKKIEQNNKDILELIMENMLLKIEKNSLIEEKNKNDMCFSDYIDLTIQKEKNSINTNINKNLNNIKKVNNKKKRHNQNNIINNGIYSLIKSEFNHDTNKNNNFANNIYNYNLLEILNKNGSKKKKKVNSCNKFNNNNYNFNFLAGSRLDLKHYHSHNKVNATYNTIGKALYDSQDNFNYHKNKNSFSLKDFRKIKNAFSQKRTKKNSYKKNKNNNKGKHSINDNKQELKFIKDKNRNGNDAQNISFRDNKMQFTEPSYNEHNKKKEKINFYCIKKIKEEMNEILKNKKNLNSSNNNISNNHINTSGNIIDNSSNNKINLPMGYNYYYPKNKNSSNLNLIVNKKNSLQNKTPKNIKNHKHTNLSEIIISDANKDTQYKINYTYGNINQKISPNHQKQNNLAKFSNYNINNNNYDNHSINTNKKRDLYNNFSGLKKLKKNMNSKSYYKLTTSKKINISNNSYKKFQKEKNYINNNCYYNDNINNNISYNLGNKNGISRNYSNYGSNCNYNNYNTYYTNNNYKTINNFNKVNSNTNLNVDDISNNTNNTNNNTQFNTNLNDNAFSMKIRNKINLSKNRMNQYLNRNNNNDRIKKNVGNNNNISTSYLLNNKEMDNKKVDFKKFACLNDENNKNETPSFYLFKK